METRNARLAALADEIVDVVEAVSLAQQVPDEDVRRLLRFIGQVITLVEQAFQDVYSVLVDLTYLQKADIHRPARIAELQRNVALLTEGSHYRDAAEICSRLRYLGEAFETFVRPTVQHLPQFQGWQGLFGLIQEHEGRIISLVRETTRELDDILKEVSRDPDRVVDIRAVATAQAMELRSLLTRLHDLNGRILGLSGRPGFLELTADRRELAQEIKIMVDKRDQSVTHGHRVEVGAGAVVSGTLTVATTIQDSFKVVQTSSASESLKAELERLCSLVEQSLQHLPEPRHADVQQDLQNLVTEATKSQPRRKWYQLSADGLIEAAKTCGALATPIIETVKKILQLVGG